MAKCTVWPLFKIFITQIFSLRKEDLVATVFRLQSHKSFWTKATLVDETFGESSGTGCRQKDHFKQLIPLNESGCSLAFTGLARNAVMDQNWKQENDKSTQTLDEE